MATLMTIRWQCTSACQNFRYQSLSQTQTSVPNNFPAHKTQPQISPIMCLPFLSDLSHKSKTLSFGICHFPSLSLYLLSSIYTSTCFSGTHLSVSLKYMYFSSYRVVFFNCSHPISVPKWKRPSSQSGLVLVTGFTETAAVIGWLAIFFLVLKLGGNS